MAGQHSRRFTRPERRTTCRSSKTFEPQRGVLYLFEGFSTLGAQRSAVRCVHFSDKLRKGYNLSSSSRCPTAGPLECIGLAQIAWTHGQDGRQGGVERSETSALAGHSDGSIF